MGREKMRKEGDELEEDLVLLEKELKRGYKKSRKKRKKKWSKGW